MIRLNPLQDMQDVEPRSRCRICDAELFEYDPRDLCPSCREEKENEE